MKFWQQVFGCYKTVRWGFQDHSGKAKCKTNWHALILQHPHILPSCIVNVRCCCVSISTWNLVATPHTLLWLVSRKMWGWFSEAEWEGGVASTNSPFVASYTNYVQHSSDIDQYAWRCHISSTFFHQQQKFNYNVFTGLESYDLSFFVMLYSIYVTEVLNFQKKEESKNPLYIIIWFLDRTLIDRTLRIVQSIPNAMGLDLRSRNGASFHWKHALWPRWYSGCLPTNDEHPAHWCVFICLCLYWWSSHLQPILEEAHLAPHRSLHPAQSSQSHCKTDEVPTCESVLSSDMWSD